MKPLIKLAKNVFFSGAGVLLAGTALAVPPSWLAGQDSPVHEDDLRTPVSGKTLVLENSQYQLTFDGVSGALLEMTDKRNGWRVAARRPELAKSFQLFAPTADRRFNPVMGDNVKLASAIRSVDGHELTLVWSQLPSEYGGRLDITLTGHVLLTDDGADFDGTVENRSSLMVENVIWPILSDIQPRQPNDHLDITYSMYSQLFKKSLAPAFRNEIGYWGGNNPGVAVDGDYHMLGGPTEGVYVGNHDASQHEYIRFMYLSRPGYQDTFNSYMVFGSIDGRPSRLELDVEHFPFAAAGKTKTLGVVHIAPYQGTWQAGVDIRRHWRATWFKPQPRPDWIDGIHSWQQIQIDSPEEDLRTPFADLYARVEQAAKHGVAAIQLVGWNYGGQDRGNPSHDADPRLGGVSALKKAIADIQNKLGVHIILFSKFTWADMTRADYETRLRPHVAIDPYGIPYQGAGYNYQTPTQLAGLNTRRFAIGDTLDPTWREISAQEFSKVLDLGADGFLYDEAQHHGGVQYSFAAGHGYEAPGYIYAGDVLLAKRFHEMVTAQNRQKKFLFAAEAPYEQEQQYYPLTYTRIGLFEGGHLPGLRYLDPFLPIMLEVSGFDDREMINHALLYRYIISYEPFNFKGNTDDFPLTTAYGEKVDALRKQYRSWLWDSEYRDVLGASVSLDGNSYHDYAVFRHPQSGKVTMVVVNNDKTATQKLHFAFDHATGALLAASPEDPIPKPVTDQVQVPPRSAVVIMEQ